VDHETFDRSLHASPLAFAPLLAAARRGEQQALERLFGELRDIVCGRARGRGDASDVAQDVMLKLHEHFGLFQGQTWPELLAWAQKVLGNQLIDDHRHDRAQVRDEGREVAGGDLFPGLPAGGTTPSRAAVRNEEEARLREAVGRLPERMRQVVLLRMEGLPFAEVARRVGVSVENARVLMFRATVKLQAELGGQQ
jgi:RNA polymerase sigma-70 factor (ECF subfamily)